MDEPGAMLMEINRSAPATAEARIVVDADPQTVFAVIAAVADWPSWNPDVKSVTLDDAVAPGATFTWKSGGATLRSTMQVVDPPSEIGWTGTTMGIKAVHVFRFEAKDGGTLARSEESWDGLLARVLRSYSRKAIDKTINRVLEHLKVEAERRVAAA